MTRPAPHDANDSPVAPAVLFLDIDGVLNSDETYRRARDEAWMLATEETSLCLFEPDLCARVQGVCDAAGAEIVVASSWRHMYPLDAIARMFAARGLTARVRGAIGKADDSDRYRAVQAWLADHPCVTAWCVLDDDPRGYGYPHETLRVRYHDPRFNGRCVHPRDGVTDDDAARCIAILRGGPQP